MKQEQGHHLILAMADAPFCLPTRLVRLTEKGECIKARCFNEYAKGMIDEDDF